MEKQTDFSKFLILRRKGTELKFTGEYLNHKESGVYHCRACELPVFKSNTKYDSGSGWPSFNDAIENHIELIQDRTHGMLRTEIVCARCGSHLVTFSMTVPGQLESAIAQTLFH